MNTLTCIVFSCMTTCLCLMGCAEVTRPIPTAPEVEAVQLVALTRHPNSTYSEERAMRVFLRLLPTLPQIHGRTYPFLGFNWWLTEADHPVVDNVWYPSPAHDRPLRRDVATLDDPHDSRPPPPDAGAALKQGDIILAVNGMPIPTWVKQWDRLCRFLRDQFRYTLSGEVLVDLVLMARYGRQEAEGIYRGGPVTLLLDRQGVRKQVTLYPVHLPAEYGFLIVAGRSGSEVNAFAAPGRIMITRRFLNLCRTDDELAIVLGHELAHHALGHLARQQGQYAAVGFVGDVLGFFLRLVPWPVKTPYRPVDEDIRRVVQGAAFSVYNRQDEREADAYGLWYAFQAGYDVEQGILIWERVSAAAQRNVFENTYFLDSHPAAPERLARLKKIALLFKEGKAAEVFLQ
ncbi:M48 family metalloprotease [Desulfobacca acetoxidans]|nr:M48 family metalloprotease [Desulfobacca acetoxidans]